MASLSIKDLISSAEGGFAGSFGVLGAARSALTATRMVAFEEKIKSLELSDLCHVQKWSILPMMPPRKQREREADDTVASAKSSGPIRKHARGELKETQLCLHLEKKTMERLCALRDRMSVGEAKPSLGALVRHFLVIGMDLGIAEQKSPAERAA